MFPVQVCLSLLRRKLLSPTPKKSYVQSLLRSRLLPCPDSRSSNTSGSRTGELILYAPLAHLPKSIFRQRSLQKGKSSSLSVTIVRQVGHRRIFFFVLTNF